MGEGGKNVPVGMGEGTGEWGGGPTTSGDEGLREKIDKGVIILITVYTRERDGCLSENKLQNGQAVLRARERNGK